MTQPRYGDQMGYVVYGQLLSNENGLIICGECGKAWKQLATHVKGAHQISADEYREKYGLSRSRKLVSAEVSHRLRESWEKHEDANLERLNQARNPLKAHRASSSHPGVLLRPETLAIRQAAGRAKRSRDLTPDETSFLTESADLQTWADHARTLLFTNTDISLAALGRACRISPGAVSQRLTRYPARSL